ncbi:hypothetical protein [Blastococcus saxobsidens]|uniref:Uncharacterized protein n=1 Tax=Blastococcus saxobsidens TaxID=138336 RepID=A0A4Q7Y624_9ACTN|nr:hypothetical protein [Blastococcus saxobsidens]RZU32340.1 hypothetical protein BKA19_2035 [Blastococcus saxobsidens]
MDVFSAQLLPRAAGPVLRRARIAGSLLPGMVSGVFPAAAEDDLVVARRADGTEGLRVPAGDPEVAAVLLQAVRRELREVAPEAFLQAWGVR